MVGASTASVEFVKFTVVVAGVGTASVELVKVEGCKEGYVLPGRH